MPKYIVECQTLVRLEIEADTKELAEQIAPYSLNEKCLYYTDSFDWCISAHEQRSEGVE